MLESRVAKLSETYRPYTLATLLDTLASMAPEAVVVGLTPSIISYRGYYERNCIEPDPTYSMYAPALYDALNSYVGGPITGYKGGDYIVSLNEYVYVSDYSMTGPVLIGFQEVGPQRFEPILLEDHDWL
jgi:hypothetical protein